MTHTAPTTIKIAGYQPPASVHTRGVEVFCKALTERLGDRVRIEFEPNIVQAGFNAQDLLARVEDGRLDMCYFSASYLADRVPEFALLDLPFMYANREQAYEVLDGPLKTVLKDKLAANTGYRLIDFWDNGFRHFSNAVRPIQTPEDCKGLKIRTLFSDLHCEVFRALGFEPKPLDVKELISGIESGDVTAQENPLTNTYNFGIHHHHRYITLSAHFFGAAALLCNANAYAAWTDDVQAAVEAAAAIATVSQRQFAANEDADMMAKFAQEDVEIATLSPDQLARFVEAVQPVIDTQKDIFGEPLFSLASPSTPS